MNRYILLLITLVIVLAAVDLIAQTSNPLDDMLLEDSKPVRKSTNITKSDSLTNDIIRVNYEKKNAKLAMLMSAIVPGAGQFYVSKSNISAYIYPVIELALIGGMIYYDKQGDDKTKDYKKYVTETITLDLNGYTYTGSRYRRDFQSSVETILKNVHSADIYDNIFFSLDNTDTQHFFEDIGKYNKYVFGWVDWYSTYAEAQPLPYGAPVNPNPTFIFTFMSPPLDAADPRINSASNKWLYNVPLNGDSWDSPSSELRNEYVKMRKDAEAEYRTGHYLGFGLALNHIVSAIDAARVTNKANSLYLSDSNVKFHYYADLSNGNVTPMLGMKISF
jgi:hypothetical protein